MEQNTAKAVVIEIGSLITLYLSISFLLVLSFGLINLTYPSAGDSYWEIESATDSIRLSIAMLLVFFPTYLYLTRLSNQYKRKGDSGSHNEIAKWLVYLSLLVGGLTILGTLVSVIYGFLNGDLTIRFILKASTILAVVGSAFYYYLQLAKGYWLKHEKESKTIGIAIGLVVGVVVVIGFMNIETPTVVREMKIDAEQITALQNIQWSIENYLQTSSTTPISLEEVYGDMPIPEASEGRAPFTYQATETGFELCAEFAYESQESEAMSVFLDPNTKIRNMDNWYHKEGEYCFKRIIK